MMYYMCDFTFPAIRKCPYVPICYIFFIYYMKKKVQSVITGLYEVYLVTFNKHQQSEQLSLP